MKIVNTKPGKKKECRKEYQCPMCKGRGDITKCLLRNTNGRPVTNAIYSCKHCGGTGRLAR